MQSQDRLGNRQPFRKFGGILGLCQKQGIDRHQYRIQLIQVDNGRAGQRLALFQVEGTTIHMSLILFPVENWEAVGTADNRTGSIKQAAMMMQERTAFASSVFPYFAANNVHLVSRQRIEGRIEGSRFYRKDRY